MAKDQSHDAGVGPSAHAGVPTPNLPPLPPSVSQAGPPPAPAAVPTPPPAPAAAATATIAPAAPPMGPESFNDRRKGLASGGGFNPRLLGIPVVIVLALVGMWMNRGTTTAEDLKAGDCFVMPVSDDEFGQVGGESIYLHEAEERAEQHSVNDEHVNR